MLRRRAGSSFRSSGLPAIGRRGGTAFLGVVIAGLFAAGIAFLTGRVASVGVPTEESASIMAADTTVVWGPVDFNGNGQGTTIDYLQSVGVTPAAGKRYVLRVQNGTGTGVDTVDRVRIRLDDYHVFGYGTLALMGVPGFDRLLPLVGSDNLDVSVDGPASGFIRLSVLEIVEIGESYVGPTTFVMPDNQETLFQTTFTVPVDKGPMHIVWIDNGNPDGSNRANEAAVWLDGAMWIGWNQVTSALGSFDRDLSVTPGTHTLKVGLRGETGDKVTVTLTGDPAEVVPVPTPEVVWGPQQFTSTGAVEDRFGMVLGVVPDSTLDYYVRVLNGAADGSQRPDETLVVLKTPTGDQSVVTPATLPALSSEEVAPFTLETTGDSMIVEVIGAAGDFVVVSVETVPAGSPEPLPNRPGVLIWGPQLMVASSAPEDNFVEALGITAEPGQRYILRMEHADGTTASPPNAVHAWVNGFKLIRPTIPATEETVQQAEITVMGFDTLVVDMEGDAGEYVEVSVYQDPDNQFSVFGHATWVKTALYNTFDTTFAIPANAAWPYTLTLLNGLPDGTNQGEHHEVWLNDALVVDWNNVLVGTDSFVTVVDLEPTNELRVTINGEVDDFVTILIEATDLTGPSVDSVTPLDNAVIGDTVVTVTGVTEVGAVVTVNGVSATLDGQGGFSADVPLSLEGPNALTITATAPGGGTTVMVRTVIRDTTNPVLAVTLPPDLSATTDSVSTVSGTVSDATAVSVNVNGIPLTVDGTGGFSGSVNLVPGTNVLIVTATDAALNATSVLRNVFRDNEDPTLVVSAPGEGTVTATSPITASGTVADSTVVTLTVNGVVVAIAPDGTWSHDVDLLEGGNTITVVATDQAGNNSTTLVNVTLQSGTPLPPDPVAVAPALSTTVVTTLYEANNFIWSDSNPIQTGVAPGTIDPLRVAVYRGKVLDTSGQPLSGTQVSVKDHPELGHTLSRADGMFDLGMNGGGTLTLEYTKSGFLPVQRHVNSEWQEFAVVDSIVMTALDTNATVVTFSQPIEVAQGSVETDADGTRQATLFFRQGTTATLVMPDGSTQPAPSITVRATEYTVGPLGEAAMPGPLPPASAYTYAVELSADEAIAVGADEVQFSQPVSLYVDNFLNFPVGTVMPLGYYDRRAGRWQPDPDGVVMQIIGVDSLGQAIIAVDTAGQAATQAQLTSHGFTSAELVELANRFAVGASFMRVQTTHFTACDVNVGRVDGPLDFSPNTQPNGNVAESNCRSGGSIIGCERQTLGEILPLVGTPFRLAYRNDRMPGWRMENLVEFPALTLIDTAGLANLPRNRMPIHGREVVYILEVAGQRRISIVPATTTMPPVSMLWDGLDAFGRPVCGSVKAKVSIGFRYDADFGIAVRPGGSGSGGGSSFGGPFRAITLTDAARNRITVLVEFERTMVGACAGRNAGIGGWELDAHHSYDPIGNVLTLGSGERRVAEPRGNVIDLVQGTQGSVVNAGGNIIFDRASPQYLAAAPNGGVFIAYPGEGLIRRLGPDGTLTVYATGLSPTGIDLAPDGTLYAALKTSHTVAAVDTSGTWSVVAGTGAVGGTGDGGLATAAQLNDPTDVAVGPDGSLFITEGNGARVRRVAPDGIISLFAGNGGTLFPWSDFEDSLAVNVPVPTPMSVDVGPDGTVYFTSGSLVRKVSPDGVLTTIAGRLQSWTGPTPATQTDIGQPRQIHIAADGLLYIASGGFVYRVTPNGDITPVAGTGALRCSVVCLPSGNGGIATQALFGFAVGVALATDGTVYVSDDPDHQVRAIKPALPGLGVNDMLIASESGSEVYHFDRSGTHLATLDGLSGDSLLTFGYNGTSQLLTLTDAFGNVTTVERDSITSDPTAILGPFGQRTTLTVDGNRHLASIADPGGNIVRPFHDASGILDSLQNPRGFFTRFSYDTLGRLLRDDDPAGGFTTLARTETDSGFIVTKTTAEGRTQASEIHFGSDGTGTINLTRATGLTTTTRESPNGSTTITGADGTVVTLVLGGDSRFGAQSQVLQSLTTQTPGGLVSTITTNRSVVLADSADPFSIATIIDQVTANGLTSTRTYDAATLAFVDQTPVGRQLTTTTDSLGRIIQVAAPGFASINYRFDSRGRLDSILSGGRTTAFTYDSFGRLATSTNALGLTDSLFYDSADRLERRVLPGSRVIRFAYDSVGNLTGVTPPGRPTHGFGYTSVGQVHSYDPPNVGLTTPSNTYSYNLDRQLTSITRPDSLAIGVGYDSAARPTQVSFDRGVIAMGYSPTTGNLIQLDAPGGESLSYTFDGSLPMTATWAGTVSGAVALGYDSGFRVVSEAVNGDTVHFGYDNDGLLTTAGLVDIKRVASSGLIERDSLGAMTSDWTFTDRGTLQDHLVKHSDTLVFRRNYSRDSLNRIKEVIETFQGVTDTIAYSYDSAGRLLEVLKNAVAQATYLYDANGNRKTVTRPGGIETGTFDNQDRLLTYAGTAYEYTANGELRFKIDGVDTTTYAYDALGNLVQVVLPNGTVVEYVIDPQSRRIGRRIDGSLTHRYLYHNQLKPVAELDSTGAVLSRFVYGRSPIAPDYMVRGGIVYRLITDHLGSVRLVVEVPTGQVVQELEYDGYGRVVRNTSPGFQPFGFAGGLLDDLTGLVRFGHRDYDPHLARWTAKDPLGFAGGDGNLYSYVLNDPINNLDPSGTRVYDACETERIIDDVRNNAIQNGIVGVLREHDRSAPFDVKNLKGEPRDYYDVGGDRPLIDDEFGNYIAGYAGVYANAVLGPIGVWLGGVWIDGEDAYRAKRLRDFDFDLDSRPAIGAGQRRARKELVARFMNSQPGPLSPIGAYSGYPIDPNWSPSRTPCVCGTAQ